jgi:hypothetical protein
MESVAILFADQVVLTRTIVRNLQNVLHIFMLSHNQLCYNFP